MFGCTVTLANVCVSYNHSTHNMLRIPIPKELLLSWHISAAIGEQKRVPGLETAKSSTAGFPGHWNW